MECYCKLTCCRVFPRTSFLHNNALIFNCKKVFRQLINFRFYKKFVKPIFDGKPKLKTSVWSFWWKGNWPMSSLRKSGSKWSFWKLRSWYKKRIKAHWDQARACNWSNRSAILAVHMCNKQFQSCVVFFQTKIFFSNKVEIISIQDL